MYRRLRGCGQRKTTLPRLRAKTPAFDAAQTTAVRDAILAIYRWSQP
jgi:hypothetical protein